MNFRRIISSLLQLVLALWAGGSLMYTFLVTPIIFQSYDRDMAGQIVGHTMFPYFTLNLVLSCLALMALIFLYGRGSGTGQKVALITTAAAVAVSVYVLCFLYPEIVAIKAQVQSFVSEAKDSPARQAFSRLHAVSAVLNLLFILQGMYLIVYTALNPAGKDPLH